METTKQTDRQLVEIIETYRVKEFTGDIKESPYFRKVCITEVWAEAIKKSKFEWNE